MVIEPGSRRAEIIFRALGLLEQHNARELNDPDLDLAESERQRIIAEQEEIEVMAGQLL